MTLSSLALWIINKPLATVVAVVVALFAYWLARPRDSDFCGELAVEGWRIYVMLACATVFFFVAEVTLWVFLLAYRAPLPYTGLLFGLGVMVAAFSPVPLMAGYCRCGTARGRPIATAAAMLVIGVGCILFGSQLRAAAWSDLSARAVADQGALHEVVRLRGYLYVSSDEARQVLDAALPAAADVLILEAAASESDELFLDDDLSAYAADRIDAALTGTEGDLGGVAALDTVPAIWRLTRSPERTLLAYARAVPELRSDYNGDSIDLDYQRLVVHALENAPDEILSVVAAAAFPLVGREPLSPSTVQHLALYVDGDGPAGRVAMTLLVHDASSNALRHVVHRFNDPDDVAWEVLAQVCPDRTAGFTMLSEDSDPAVAAGATAALVEVKRLCTDWSAFTGP